MTAPAARFLALDETLALGAATLPAKPASLHRSELARTSIKRLSDWRWPLFYDHAAQLFSDTSEKYDQGVRPLGWQGGRLAKLGRAFDSFASGGW